MVKRRTTRPKRKGPKTKRKGPKTKRKSPKMKDPKIVDPEFSKETHKGTKASSHCELCERSYHYQSYATFSEYIEILHKMHALKHAYIPEDFSDMTLELKMKTNVLKPLYIGVKQFVKEINQGMKKPSTYLIPIILNLEIDTNDNHANCLVINLRTSQIELFEPHGYRTSASTLGGNPGAYNMKVKTLRRFFDRHVPGYRVINVVEEVKKTAFQTKNDPQRSTGYCVTWSLLYTHYRMLNPLIEYPTLVRYIDSKITTRLLLRYARNVEETLKSHKFDDT
jgi:hypothetical protein